VKSTHLVLFIGCLLAFTGPTGAIVSDNKGQNPLPKELLDEIKLIEPERGASLLKWISNEEFLKSDTGRALIEMSEKSKLFNFEERKEDRADGKKATRVAELCF